MSAKKILALADLFIELVKEADVREHMARRIFFSLLGRLVKPNEQSRIALTKGIVDYKVLESLVTGAKELVEYGALACEEEISYFHGTAKSEPKGDSTADLLTWAIKIFQDKNGWAPNFGGEPWRKIAQALLDLLKMINSVTEAKKLLSDPNLAPEERAMLQDSYFDSLKEMTALLNVVDGLCHNSGSIMEKIHAMEPSNSYNSYNQLRRLMDAKELSKEEDVLAEIMPFIENTDAGLPLRDWVGPARQLAEKQQHPYNRDLELKAIRSKKQRAWELEELFKTQSENLKKIKSFINYDYEEFIEKIKEIYSIVNFVSGKFYWFSIEVWGGEGGIIRQLQLDFSEALRAITALKEKLKNVEFGLISKTNQMRDHDKMIVEKIQDKLSKALNIVGHLREIHDNMTDDEVQRAQKAEAPSWWQPEKRKQVSLPRSRPPRPEGD